MVESCGVGMGKSCDDLLIKFSDEEKVESCDDRTVKPCGAERVESDDGESFKPECTKPCGLNAEELMMMIELMGDT
jgi:hypothetical protein